MSSEASVPSTCPRCAVPLVSLFSAEPWCGSCEWNLDRYEPDARPRELGWRALDRRATALAHRLTRQQFAHLSGARGTPAGERDRVRTALVAISVLLIVLDVTVIAAGVWLCAQGFPGPALLVGAGVCAVGVGLLPRFGSLDRRARRLDRSDAPTLFPLIDRVAGAIGAPVPDVVTVESSFNASAGAVGLRRRRVLNLGLCLWGVLEPQQRVALLGHELGHYVNGDVRSGLLTQPAMTTFARLADMLRPGAAGSRGFLVVLTNAVLRVASSLAAGLHAAVVWIGLRSTQRAEYLADELAARAAGTDGALGMLDSLVLAKGLAMSVARCCRTGAPVDRWARAGARVRAEAAENMAVRRQLSVRRETSLFATHPPAGLRVRLLAGRTATPPTVTLSDVESGMIDRELAGEYRRVVPELAHAN